jgi:hypothetical protein
MLAHPCGAAFEVPPGIDSQMEPANGLEPLTY